MFGSKSKDLPGIPRDVQRVYNLLTPKPKELLDHGFNRRFIREGEVGMYNHKEKRTKRRYLFLFNDVLLITKREGKSSFWLKVFISLRSSLTVEDVPDSTTKHKVEFRIYAPKKTIILFTHTEDEKIIWLRDLKNALAGEYSEKKQSHEKQEQPKEQLFISGDIGTIEIPGLDTASTSLSNQAKRLSGERSDFGFGDDSDFIQYSSKSKHQAATVPVHALGVPDAFPATPSSTPVQSSIFDEFDSLANRSYSSTQPTVFATGNSNTFDQISFNNSNSAPLPATNNANIPNLLQPTSTFNQQPVQPSTSLLTPTLSFQPTLLHPSSTGILQPTPSNPAPAPLQSSGDFSALRSLNQQPQQPQQTAGQLFTSLQAPATNSSPYSSLQQTPLQPTQGQFNLLGQPATQSFGQQPFGQVASQPFGQQPFGQAGTQSFGQAGTQSFGQQGAFTPSYQSQMQQFQQLQQMQQMQQMQQLQAQQRMFGSGN